MCIEERRFLDKIRLWKLEKEVKLDEQDLCRSTNNYKPDDY